MSLRAMELLALIVAIAVAAVAILSLGGGQTADEHPSYDYPDGVAVDWEAGTVSMEGAGTWYVLDLTAPYGTATDGGLEVAGWETMHGDTIRLGPGIYTLRTGDLEFDVVMDGEIRREATWQYDLDGAVHAVTVAYGIDPHDLYAEYLVAEAYNGENSAGGEDTRRFSDLPGLAMGSDTVDSLVDSLASEFSRIGGDAGDRQALADFLASFPQLAIEYPDRVYEGGSIAGEDMEIYGADEYWATPLQTLAMMKGDCEDTAVLLVAMYASAGYDAAVGGTNGHVFAGVAILGFEEVPADRLDDLGYGYFRLAASVPVEGTCEGETASTVFYAAETTRDQVPVGYMSGGSSQFGRGTHWGTAGFYPLDAAERSSQMSGSGAESGIHGTL